MAKRCLQIAATITTALCAPLPAAEGDTVTRWPQQENDSCSGLYMFYAGFLLVLFLAGLIGWKCSRLKKDKNEQEIYESPTMHDINEEIISIHIITNDSSSVVGDWKPGEL